MAETSKHYTAFTVPNRGLFQFRRMPFGLTNSPATWQRLVDRVLSGNLENNVFVYLDDVIVVTKDFEHHLKVLEEVLTKLSSAGLVINYSKCVFCRPELKYLGYVVGENGLQVDPEKVRSILEIPLPKNVKEIRSFIGIISWYRRFVPNFSSLIAPLTNLLKKKSKFNWTVECEESFRLVKEKLVSAPILTCPNFDHPFYVHADASGFGIGAVLTQRIGDDEHTIAYLSRSLNRCERNYSTTERECLAVLRAVEKLRPYLEGTRFTVVTDHASLVWLNNLRDPTGRLARWAVKLQQYDFDVVHRKGKEHLLPDMLSRSVPVVDSAAVGESAKITDKWYARMEKCVKTKSNKYPNWRFEEGKLWKHLKTQYPSLSGDSWKEVIPKDKRKELLLRAHDEPIAGHTGIQKSYDRLKQFYYWPKMRKDVASYVRGCTVCQSTKPELKKTAGLMATRRIADQPWKTISVDLIGPLPRSYRGYKYILTVVDQLSKFPLFFPLRSANAKSVVQVLEDSVFLLFGVPRDLVCDNGVQFRSNEMKKLTENYGVDLKFTAYYHPQANPAERVNQTVKTMLRAYVSDNHREWDAQLPKVACAIRTSTHEVTKLTPYFINFGKEMFTNGKQYTSNSNSLIDPAARSEALEVVRQDMRKRLIKAANEYKGKYDLRRRDQQYLPNDLVWRTNFMLSDAAKYFSAKLAPKFVGPYIVARRLSPWTYELKDKSGKSQGIWHCKNLRLYTHRPPEE